jgi:ribosomal protein S18 acetylase RimI-like enzyme
MAPRRKAESRPVDPTALRRETAGRYVSGDGRFKVEQSSGGWLIEDGAQANELGLPLVRGPFTTLADARAALAGAREAPMPASPLAERLAAAPAARTEPSSGGRSVRARPARQAPPSPPPVPPVTVRDFRTGDGPGLRALWEAVDMRALGDDDDGLGRMARRNPGLLLVAVRDGTIVGSALGGWDGRRGWIYHVAVAEAERRTGLATRLVRLVESRLGALGAPKVNVLVQEDNLDGAAFWEASGYAAVRTRQFGRELGPDADSEA